MKDGFRLSINPNEICYCQNEDCGEPLLYLFSYEKRKYCHCCTQRMKAIGEETECLPLTASR